MPIDMFEHALRGTAVKLRLGSINVSRAGLFDRVAEFTVDGLLIKAHSDVQIYLAHGGKVSLSYNVFSVEHNVVNRRPVRSLQNVK